MKKRFAILIGLITAIALVGIVYYFCFIKNGILIPCLFYQITGLYCPGCGITRMILSLLRLDFYQAFRFNPLIFIALPFIIVLFIDMFFKWLVGKENYLYMKINDKAWIVLLIITLLFGVLRNLPFFEYFIPTVI